MRFFAPFGATGLWILSSSLLTLATPISCMKVAPTNLVTASVSAVPIQPRQLQQLAKEITVKIQAATVTGSGVLLKRRGQTYHILTNAHNLVGTDQAQIQTSDGAWHQARRVTLSALGDNDLALLAFTSNHTYQLATWSNPAMAQQGLEIVAVGFEFDQTEITISNGRVSKILAQPLKQGYQLGYSSRIRQGMSGGPILDLQGQLVGVNAMSAYPIINSAYVFTDGSRPNGSIVKQLRKSNWGIPIHPYAECLRQML